MSVAPADLGGPYDTVFDVGAFRGDFAKACRQAWPECVVYSFEPLEPEPADRPRHGDFWHWKPIALGNQTEVVEINRNVFVPSSSILPMAGLHEQAFPYTRGSEPVRVGMSTIAEFGELIVAPALLKIDVQGYELQVLKGAGEWLSAFQAVVLETSWEPLYHGQPAPVELAKVLQANDFVHTARVDALYHPKAPKLLLQSDELWVRP